MNADKQAFPVSTENPLIKSDGMTYREYLIAKIAQGRAQRGLGSHFAEYVIIAADDILKML